MAFSQTQKSDSKDRKPLRVEVNHYIRDHNAPVGHLAPAVTAPPAPPLLTTPLTLRSRIDEPEIIEIEDSAIQTQLEDPVIQT